MARLPRPGTIACATAVILAGASSLPGAATAQIDDSRGPPALVACGFKVSEPVQSVWRDLGGEAGRLGCATTNESATSTSPRGSAARVAVFGLNGEIVLHTSGPRAGQAYAVWGCAYRLYVQFGGSSGWLGLPIDEAANTPDGSRQTFEGGTIDYTRAYDNCEATPTQAAPSVAAVVAETPLDLFENPANGDRLSLASAGSVAQAVGAGYQRVRGQALVLAEAAPGATPLQVFENDASDRRETLAASQSQNDALAAGFVFEANQGFIWTDPRPNTVALKLFRKPGDEGSRLTASPADEREAVAAGYSFVRIEGYADPVR
jgi:hypothetical protein